MTAGVYQPEFRPGGAGGEHNTPQAAYIAKLSPDGSQLVWGSYFGAGGFHRDLDIGPDGNIYVT